MKIYEITVENADKPGLVEYRPDEDATTTTATSAGKDSTVVGTVNADASTHSTGTNMTIQTTSTATTNAVKSTVADKKTPPPFDPMLDETKQILLDYISLLSRSGVMVVHE